MTTRRCTVRQQHASERTFRFYTVRSSASARRFTGSKSYCSPWPQILPAGTPLGASLELRTPLELVLEQDDGGVWVASDRVLLMYGVGPSPSQAIDDYCAALCGHFMLSQHDLDPQMPADRQALSRLDQYVRRVP